MEDNQTLLNVLSAFAIVYLILVNGRASNLYCYGYWLHVKSIDNMRQGFNTMIDVSCGYLTAPFKSRRYTVLGKILIGVWTFVFRIPVFLVMMVINIINGLLYILKSMVIHMD